MLVASCVNEYTLYFEIFLLTGNGINPYFSGNCCILLELLNTEECWGGLVNRVSNRTLSNSNCQYSARERCADALVKSYTFYNIHNISVVFCVT